MASTTARPGVSAFLRVCWDDRAGIGEVVVIQESNGERSEVFARTCDAWCFSYHVQKGAQRLCEAIVDHEGLPLSPELSLDL